MKTVQFISVTPEELQARIVEGVKNHLDDLKEFYQPKEPTEYLTRAEVADLRKVDISTIFNWSKSKKLTPHGIGGRVYFKRKEVEAAIIKLNP
ncbi:MAG: DNA-binding protein [Leeuwenhoekiella sp.]|mgnify:FL=1|uniref:helix-turn-helix domain-containing protein n=1 Tax=Leeuwenhoekiella blandensis TaxID=360293 RepID=UPI000C3B6BEF|nr:helix-turn-helix domain-containing protein [Leeuwenhoekiella blandensis]MBQ53134.1 DNA-binding protein [Leeuwenhoekiella sp.]|tara:strand:+ start:517 stop:795 length:279 start_codon:yes stop_codon:yes gene_type:complete